MHYYALSILKRQYNWIDLSVHVLHLWMKILMTMHIREFVVSCIFPNVADHCFSTSSLDRVTFIVIPCNKNTSLKSLLSSGFHHLRCVNVCVSV